MLFITETPEDIHVRRYSYVTPFKQSLIDELEKQDCFWKQFETAEEANLYMNNYIFEDAKNYTKLISSLPISDYFSNTQCRKVIVYIDGITEPGFYMLPLNHYYILNQYAKIVNLDDCTKAKHVLKIYEEYYDEIQALFEK